MAEATLDHLAVVESCLLATEPGHHDTRRFEIPHSLSATRSPVPKVWRSLERCLAIVKMLRRVGDECMVRVIGVVAQGRYSEGPSDVEAIYPDPIRRQPTGRADHPSAIGC